MPDYSVTWSIDIFDADDPREAAERAEAIMRRPIDPEDRLQARVYEVIEQIPPGRGRLAEPITVDLAAAPDDADDADPEACTNPAGHSWVCTGAAYGGDDKRWCGEGRSYCEYCGADGDA